MTAITRDLQINLARHNIGIARAKREYDTHPIAACIYAACFNLVAAGEQACGECFDRLAGARARMQQRRGADDAA